MLYQVMVIEEGNPKCVFRTARNGGPEIATYDSKEDAQAYIDNVCLVNCPGETYYIDEHADESTVVKDEVFVQEYYDSILL